MRLRFFERLLHPFRSPDVKRAHERVLAPPLPRPSHAPPLAPPIAPVPKATVPMALVPLGAPSADAASVTRPWSTRLESPRVYPADLHVMKAVSDPSDEEIARAQLRPLGRDGEGGKAGKLAGVTEKMIVEDAHTGRRYVFKKPDEKTLAFERELVALRLRRAVGQPSVSVAEHTVTMPDGKVQTGYVKPFVECTGALPNDPRQWTDRQKTAVLVDHLWAELTGNYDTKPLQYVVVGDSALNIDWDHAIRDAEKRPDSPWGLLSRHKAGAVVPAAQRLLLSSWVRGEIELDTAPLWQALAEIERLGRADFAYAVAPLVDASTAKGKRLGDFTTGDDLVDHMMERKDNLRWRFGEMLRRTENERDTWRLVHDGKRTGVDKRLLRSFGEARLTVLTMAMSTPIFDVAYQVSQKWNQWRSGRES